MTPEDYWNSEGVRFLNDDGTLPTMEERVKRGFEAGRVDAFSNALPMDRDEIERSLMGHAFTRAARLLMDKNRTKGGVK